MASILEYKTMHEDNKDEIRDDRGIFWIEDDESYDESCSQPIMSNDKVCWWDDSESEDGEDEDLSSLTIDTIRKRLCSDVSAFTEDTDELSETSCWRQDSSSSLSSKSSRVQFCLENTSVFEYEPPEHDLEELFYCEEELQKFRDLYIHDDEAEAIMSSA